MCKLTFIFILFWISIISCNHSNKPIQKDIVIDDYSVTITFSSFWDCGEFQKIILNNLRGGDPEIGKYIQKDHLYTINFEGKCKPPAHSDTIVKMLTELQSDSIFNLANKFIDNFRLNNHVKSFKELDKPVLDGANVNIEVCLMHKSKSAAYYSYGHLNEVSADLNRLMEYIGSLNNKK